MAQHQALINSGTGAWQKWNVAVNGVNFEITAPDGTVTIAALEAALTQQIELGYIATAPMFLEQLRMKTVSIFAGTTTLVVNPIFGSDGSLILIAPYDLKVDLDPGNYAPVDGKLDLYGSKTSSAGAEVMAILITSTVDNIDQLTTGSLDVYMKYSALPSVTID